MISEIISFFQGFHDVYKRNERTTRKKFWNNHDRKGNFFRSGMNNGGRNEDISRTKINSDFNGVSTLT